MTLTSTVPPVAPPTGHTFVCYARHDEAFVFDVARALHQRGIRVWIDQWHITDGDDWGRSIDAALAGCETFLIVLSPDALASDEVRGELRVAFDNRKRIIPLLHRPCDLPGRLRLKQLIDFTRFTEHRDELLDRLAHALRSDRSRHLLIPTPEQERRTRRMLLDDVQGEARDRLRFLDADRAIRLQLEEQPHQVAGVWDEEGGVSLPRRRSPVKEILEVFDRETVGGRLLILGAPGSGKTTVLLQLLQVLAGRALVDPQRPIPVLLGLASWKADKPIADWLVEQLTIKHGVRSDFGSRWRDQRRFALLLDGLDEVDADLQPACVEAINEFRRAHRPPHLVVCCRLAEYENFAARLQLGSAVTILPLEDDQIHGYVDRAGRPELWNALRADPDLIAMARSPLLLSFMSELPADSRDRPPPDAPRASERRSRLLDTYLNWRLSGASSPSSYSREETRRWLGHLATLLERQRLSGFLLERMQPGWLSSPAQQWCFRAGVLVCAAAVVVLVLTLLQVVFDLTEPGAIGLQLSESALKALTASARSIDWTVRLLIAVAVGALIASRRTIVPIETLTWSWPRALSNMQQWASTVAWAALDYCHGLGALMGVVSYFIVFGTAGAESPVRRAGSLTGATAGLVAVALLAFVRPSTWLNPFARPTLSPRVVAAIVGGAMTLALMLWTSALGNDALSVVNVLASLASSVSVIAIVGLSRLAGRQAVRLVQVMLIGAIGGAIIAMLSTLAGAGVPILVWASAWTSGSAVLALAVALIGALPQQIRPRQLSDRAPAREPAVRGWARTLGLALVVGLMLGAAAVTLGRLAGQGALRETALFLVYFDSSFHLLLVFALMGAVSLALGGTITAGLLAGLVGFLSGATGANIERRLVPNQGIRQSARNVVVFAALGAAIVGLPYGVLNLSVGALVMQTRPSPADWLRLAVAPGMTFGMLAGLLPGAAVIQHFVLRLVLWANGVVPLRYVRFLNFAMQRRLLQRVGGRYRFIHVLLRDHLVAAPR